MLSLVLRLAVGGVFAVSGWAKLTDIEQAIRSVRAYDLLPEAAVPTVGTALPVVELGLAALLVVGLATRLAAACTWLLCSAFLVGVGSAWARGLQIECGCFGDGGFTANPVPGYVREIALNTVLIAVAAWLVHRPAGRLSLDGALRPTPQANGAPPS